MSRLTKRPKRAVQRHETHSIAEVTSITRMSINRWTACVEYHYGLAKWPERVTFTRTPYTRTLDVVLVEDSDYPHDRERRIVVTKGIDMVSTITNFIIAGRW